MSRLALALIALAAFAPATTLADEPPFVRQSDVIYGRKFGTALTMDVFRPKGPSNGLGLVYVISGGWFSAPENASPAFITPMTERGYTVFAVAHGSQPMYTIPEIVKDMNRSIRFIRHHAKDYAIDPARLGIYGGSAGGHLSLMVGTAGDAGDPKAKDPVDREPSRVAAVACFFPPTDFLNYGKPDQDAIGRGILAAYAAPFAFREFDPARRAFAPITDEAKIRELGRKISPINHVSPDDPPTLIIHGDADTLVPIQQAELIVAKFKEAGVEAKLVAKAGQGHGWPTLPKDIPTLADWFDAHLKVATVSDAPLPAKQAKHHVGEARTVAMTVQATKDAASHREIYLDSESNFRDPDDFAVVIAYDHLDRFKAAGIADIAAHYKGKSIRVAGTIIFEHDQPRIRVDEPGKIAVVE